MTIATIPEYKKTFTMGVCSGPIVIDPHIAWDQCSIDVLEQSVEGLFAYNLSDPGYKIIPRLAADTFNNHTAWSPNKKEITIPLRRYVYFHDGTPFNANVVKWSFDRLFHFINTSETLSESTEISSLKCLYIWPNASFTSIIKEVVVLDEYTVKFILNKQYSSFLTLLCHTGSKIVSPSSTPAKNYINVLTGTVVGTGPFEYDCYFEDIEVRFHRFENYWRKNSEVEILVFSIIEETSARNQALIGGSIHAIKEPLDDLKNKMEDDPNIKIWEGSQSMTIQYLGMNNRVINKTERQAISYAIDYDFIINTLKGGNAVRLKSPIPNGILHSRWNFEVATYNITKARNIIKEAYPFSPKVDNVITQDNPWRSLASNEQTALASYIFAYINDNWFHEELLALLRNNLSQIGIHIVGEGLPYPEFIDRLLNTPGNPLYTLDLYWIEWNPSIIDPFYYIYPQLHPQSRFNFAQVNDSYLNSLLSSVIEEPDAFEKEKMYYLIQKYLVEDLMPWAYGICRLQWWPYRNNVIGLESYAFNPVGITYLYHVDIKEN